MAKRTVQQKFRQQDFHRFTKGGTVAATDVHRGAGIKPGDGNTDALLSTLRNFGDITQQVSKDRIARLKEEGLIAAARGDAKPDNAWSGKAYEVANGMGAKTAFKTSMAAKSEEIFRNDPDIKRSKYESLMKKHANVFTKDESDFFVVGLHDTMIEQEQSLGAKWTTHETAKMNVEGKGTLTQMIIDATEEVIAIPDEGISDEDRAKLLRAEVNYIYEMTNLYRLDKPDFTGHVTKVLGEKYAAEGSPGKLSWMVMPDSSGIVPSQTKDGIAAEDYIKAAHGVRNQKLKNRETEAQRQLDEMKDIMSRDFITAANSLKPHDSAGWGKLKADLVKYKDSFSPAQYNSYNQMIVNMQDRGNFSQTGNDVVVQHNLTIKAENGTLTAADLNAHTSFLEQPTWIKIFEKMHKYNNAKLKGSTKRSPAEKTLDGLTRHIVKLAGGTLDISGQIDVKLDGGEKVKRFVTATFIAWRNIVTDPKDIVDSEGLVDRKKYEIAVQEMWGRLKDDFPELTKKHIRDSKGDYKEVSEDTIPEPQQVERRRVQIDKLNARIEKGKK